MVIADRRISWAPPTTDTNGAPLTNLAGYELLYGKERGVYEGTVAIPDPAATEIELDLPGGSYFFALVAYDTNNERSDLSNVIAKFVAED